MFRIVAGSDAWRGYTHAFSSRLRVRARFVVVVHNVYIHPLTPIATIVYPVVDHVVAHIHPFICLSTWSRTESGCTGDMMGYQVMMIGGSTTAPVSAIAMRSLGMTGIVQAL